MVTGNDTEGRYARLVCDISMGMSDDESSRALRMQKPGP